MILKNHATGQRSTRGPPASHSAAAAAASPYPLLPSPSTRANTAKTRHAARSSLAGPRAHPPPPPSRRLWRRPRPPGTRAAPVPAAEGGSRGPRHRGRAVVRGRERPPGVAEPGGGGAGHAVGRRGQGEACRHPRAALRRRCSVPGLSLSRAPARKS
jgi:hypothetical protein